MSKGKKVIIISILVLSLIGCLVIYWEGELPATATLPEGALARVQIQGFLPAENLWKK